MVDASLTMYLAEAGVESISWTPVTQTMLVAVCELTAHSTSPIITVAELKQNDVISNDLHVIKILDIASNMCHGIIHDNIENVPESSSTDCDASATGSDAKRRVDVRHLSADVCEAIDEI